jgi:four helix bundle protein
VGFQNFREILAWQSGKAPALMICRHTDRLPSEERFGLAAQLRQAAVSVPSNIAEGFGRDTRAELSKHCRIARGSLFELMTQLELAHELGLLDPDPAVQGKVSETDRLLQGLIRPLVD